MSEKNASVQSKTSDVSEDSGYHGFNMKETLKNYPTIKDLKHQLSELKDELTTQIL